MAEKRIPQQLNAEEKSQRLNIQGQDNSILSELVEAENDNEADFFNESIDDHLNPVANSLENYQLNPRLLNGFPANLGAEQHVGQGDIQDQQNQQAVIQVQNQQLNQRENTLDARQVLLTAREAALEALRNEIKAEQSALEAVRNEIKAEQSALEAGKEELKAEKQAIEEFARKFVLQQQTQNFNNISPANVLRSQQRVLETQQRDLSAREIVPEVQSRALDEQPTRGQLQRQAQNERLKPRNQEKNQKGFFDLN